MNNPLVSIIVPVYNVQNSVARCLESVLAQTWKEIEVIVLNDGSTDGSLAICEQFRRKDPRITLIDKPNAGLSMTRNDGMKVAKGKYVQFVDSDDLLEPDFTENMVRAAEANSADLVISPYWMALPPEMVNPGEGEKLAPDAKLFLEDPSVTDRRGYKVRQYGFLPAGVYDQRAYAMQLIEKPATFYFNVVWNKLYRRQLLEAVDLWFTNDLLYAEDQQFNVRYLQYAKVIASIDTPGYYYIQNPRRHRDAEQAADAALLQRAVHKAGHLRRSTAPAVQVAGGFFRERFALQPAAARHRRRRILLGQPDRAGRLLGAGPGDRRRQPPGKTGPGLPQEKAGPKT